MSLTSLIVGTNFRPHAHTLLTLLAPGDPLRLFPEADNPYDPEAIQVLCHAEDYTAGTPVRRQLDTLGLNYIVLGYLPRATNRQLKGAPDASTLASNSVVLAWLHEAGDGNYQTTLAFGPNGEPRVRITFKGK